MDLDLLLPRARRTRALVEATRSVDVRALKRGGIISGLTGAINVDGDWLTIVGIETHLGGRRPAFLCARCEQRAYILYQRGARYACRKCFDLGYETEYLTKYDRLLRKAFKIRGQLGQVEGGVVAPFPKRPKGWWCHSYFRIRNRGMAVEREIAWRLAKRYGILPAGEYVRRSRRQLNALWHNACQ